MDRTRIARSMLRIARELVGAKFTDGLGEDSDNTNARYDAQYEQILHRLYPQDVVHRIIMSGHGLDRAMPVRGTMGNGNIVLKYYADPDEKRFIIEALVSERHRIMPSDTRDIISLYNFLKKQVEDGYTILTDCNSYSITFLASFARKNGYYFHAGRERNMFGPTGDPRDNSRFCICCKDKPSGQGANNADQFTKDRPALERQVSRQEGMDGN